MGEILSAKLQILVDILSHLPGHVNFMRPPAMADAYAKDKPGQHWATHRRTDQTRSFEAEKLAKNPFEFAIGRVYVPEKAWCISLKSPARW